MLKFRSLTLVACALLLSLTASAQIVAMSTNINGTRTSFTVVVEDAIVVTLNTYGEVLRMHPLHEVNTHPLEMRYYSDFRDYEAGKVEYLGDIHFTYYSNFRSYEAGKIKSIGNTTFTYYSDFRNHEAGKIKSIGTTTLTYNSDFRDYEAGKLASLGSIKFAYHSDFRDYEAGKLKSIGNYQYTYHSGMMQSKGTLKSGYANLKINNIKIFVNGVRGGR